MTCQACGSKYQILAGYVWRCGIDDGAGLCRWVAVGRCCFENESSRFNDDCEECQAEIRRLDARGQQLAMGREDH